MPRTEAGKRLAAERDACLGVQCQHATDEDIDAIEFEASLKPSVIGYNLSDLLADELEVGKSYEVEMENSTTAISKYDGYLTGCGEKTCIHHQKKSLRRTTQDNYTPAGHMCISKLIRKVK